MGEEKAAFWAKGVENIYFEDPETHYQVLESMEGYWIGKAEIFCLFKGLVQLHLTEMKETVNNMFKVIRLNSKYNLEINYIANKTKQKLKGNFNRHFFDTEPHPQFVTLSYLIAGNGAESVGLSGVFIISVNLVLAVRGGDCGDNSH